jgi:ubiquinone/menaquinone biosynthesis C-methylase UbiE
VRLILLLLRPVYFLLYHQFAWLYDTVASIVSLGRWNTWIQTVFPQINGRVLELGFGPGHLQIFMNERGLQAFGLDVSMQMARQASQRLRKCGWSSRILCGYAQYAPFKHKTFDSVVATFPSEYIFNPRTLKEIQRILVPAGRLVILPIAWITGDHPIERLMAWIFHLSGETPDKPGMMLPEGIDRLSKAGFEVRSELVDLKGSQVLVILAVKKPDS